MYLFRFLQHLLLNLIGLKSLSTLFFEELRLLELLRTYALSSMRMFTHSFLGELCVQTGRQISFVRLCLQLGALGGARERLKAPSSAWERLEVPGSAWKCLGELRGTWSACDRPGGRGNVWNPGERLTAWERLGMLGSGWERLEATGSACERLGELWSV